MNRAFETIGKARLRGELKNYGVVDNERKWFQCFFNERFQRTKIDEMLSDIIENKLGIQESSILGELSFIIYINDIIATLLIRDNIKICLHGWYINLCAW